MARSRGQEAAVEQDPAKREELYHQLMERVEHEGPYVILFQPSRIFGVRSDIDGFLYNPTDTPSIDFATMSRK